MEKRMRGTSRSYSRRTVDDGINSRKRMGSSRRRTSNGGNRLRRSSRGSSLRTIGGDSSSWRRTMTSNTRRSISKRRMRSSWSSITINIAILLMY